MTIKNIFLAPVVLLAIGFTTCQGKPSSPNAGAAQGAAINTTIGVDAFEQKLGEQDVQLVDVRTPQEFSEGHLKNAANFDIYEPDFTSHFAELDKEKPVLVYCRSGKRSADAAALLEEAGFKEIYNLDGGILRWENAGKPLEK